LRGTFIETSQHESVEDEASGWTTTLTIVAGARRVKDCFRRQGRTLPPTTSRPARFHRASRRGYGGDAAAMRLGVGERDISRMARGECLVVDDSG
jgi:hypothetical protein